VGRLVRDSNAVAALAPGKVIGQPFSIDPTPLHDRDAMPSEPIGSEAYVTRHWAMEAFAAAEPAV
jgi:hypothetical protein